MFLERRSLSALHGKGVFSFSEREFLHFTENMFFSYSQGKSCLALLGRVLLYSQEEVCVLHGKYVFS
jgi:hypothetical protein